MKNRNNQKLQNPIDFKLVLKIHSELGIPFQPL